MPFIVGSSVPKHSLRVSLAVVLYLVLLRHVSVPAPLVPLGGPIHGVHPHPTAEAFVEAAELAAGPGEGVHGAFGRVGAGIKGD